MKNTSRFLSIFFPLFSIGFVEGNAIESTVENVVSTTPSSFVINEIQSANIDEFLDPSCNFGSWVELYNNTNETFNFDNLYISDDLHHLKKSKLISDNNPFRPGTYAIVWFGANHDIHNLVNFQLDADGGMLYISNNEGQILVQQNYPVSISRTSYARKVDGGAEWEYCGTPSPGKSNVGAVFSGVRSADPVVDTDSRLFTSPFDIKVDIPIGAELLYTQDGSTPNRKQGKRSESGIFHIGDQTQVLRFCIYEPGKLPSRVVTRSYIYKDRNFHLPIISVVTDPDFLYDDYLGIFVRGNNGKPGNGQSTPCNWNRDWNRPTNVEYFTAEGKAVLNQEAHIAASGGWSRAGWPKSFKIKAKKKYEKLNYLPYAVFDSKPFLKHKTWQVRNGGNDSICRIKDAAFQEIILSSGLDVEGQACQPVVHFINGKLIGLLNLREPNNKDHAYANYGWDEEMLDQFEMSPDSGYCQRAGTEEAFLKWYALSSKVASKEYYDQVCDIVDIDEYVNYMAVHMYLGCGDYGPNNIKGYRPRVENGKFRFVLYDLDSGLLRDNPFSSFESKQNWTFAYDYDTNERLHEEIKFITIFLNMLKNDDFRKKFIDTYCLVAGSVFEPQRCNAIVDSLMKQREEVLSWEGKSPKRSANTIKSQLSGRQDKMIQSLKAYGRMQLDDADELQVKLSSDLDQGQLYINNLPVPTNKFEGTLFSPVVLQAHTPAGYRFEGWKSMGIATSQILFSTSSTWNYFDGGSLDGKNWKMSQDGVAWKQNRAPFGYNTKTNNKGFSTLLDFGPNAQNKRPTYYFQKEFFLSSLPQKQDKLIMNYAVDDGIVIYVNGKEVERFFMPEGNIDYSTFATQYAGIDPNRMRVEIPAHFFHQGKNIVAVEVHNCNAPSSDLYFDADLSLVEEGNMDGKFVSTDEFYTLPVTGQFHLRACYKPISSGDSPTNTAPVVINEISAANSIYINDYFKKKDWIELYNTTSESIDLAGMFLSDDRTHLHKCQILADQDKYNTVIKAHGHLIVWADHMVPLQQLHANFKLASEGGEIFLTAADDSWSDHLVYERHDEKFSVGRFPDGGNQWYVMSKPTISAPNVLNTYAQSFTPPEYPVGIDELASGTSRLKLSYARQQLIIMGQTVAAVRVDLYNIAGQRIIQQKLDVVNGTTTFDLPNLKRGAYIATLIDELGNQSVVKFVVTDR